MSALATDAPPIVKPVEGPLPRGCTFAEGDWRILANYWYPVALSRDIRDQPVAARLLDQRLVLYRTSQGVAAANDLCLHRGVPLSMGHLDGGELVCAYHGFRYDGNGQCVCIPAHPGAAIPPKLRLTTHPVRECYGMIWTCLANQPAGTFPELPEWDDPAYQQALPDPLDLSASAGRQLEGFMDVAHFAFLHAETFGDRDNPCVPNYPVERAPHGLHIEYQSTVGNYMRQDGSEAEPEKGVLRVFDCYVPFTARLTVHLPDGARLVILDCASPVSARETRLFAPLLRNYDTDQPLEPFIDYNVKIFNEDRAIVQAQYPEDLPIDLLEEVHIRADKTSIAYRQELGRLGLGRAFTS
ncbi:MAG: aromatic ring-hydroxylating dioxygenase subunit alpha [Terrimicrobiaceae bacterium]|nr:aromatic ring-hydroxylating dioxygenase subunit alpha [Terrimicrobiaceae bacterium]